MTDGSIPLFTPHYENGDRRKRKPDFELVAIILFAVISCITVVNNMQATTETSTKSSEDVVSIESQEDTGIVGTAAISYTPEYCIIISIDGEEYELEGKEIYDKCKDKIEEEITVKIISGSDGKSITKAK